jgi:hypothetical protein
MDYDGGARVHATQELMLPSKPTMDTLGCALHELLIS